MSSTTFQSTSLASIASRPANTQAGASRAMREMSAASARRASGVDSSICWRRSARLPLGVLQKYSALRRLVSVYGLSGASIPETQLTMKPSKVSASGSNEASQSPAASMRARDGSMAGSR